MHSKIGALILASLGLIWQPSIAWSSPAQAPEAVIATATTSIYQAIQQQCQTIESNPRQLHRLVEEILIPHADFQRMAQWVLGKNWRDADPQMRTEFITQFRHLLIRTYATAIQMASLESIQYLSPREGAKPGTMIVRTEIRRPGEAMVAINYYLYQKDGNWLVYDILVDGISLVTNYRSTFAEEVRKGGLAGLIKTLETRNNKPVTETNSELIRKRVARVCG